VATRKPAPANARFDALVRVELGCWEWTGARSWSGYGRFAVRSHSTWRVVQAHRFAYERRYGPIPAGLEVCHTCDNPPCVNPAHLFVASHAENMADMWAKGRGRPPRNLGVRNGNAALTPNDVREIRALAAAGETHRSLATAFAITHEHIGRIVRREYWRSVA
jgi:hypothetical protein